MIQSMLGRNFLIFEQNQMMAFILFSVKSRLKMSKKHDDLNQAVHRSTLAI